jgi:hypothetical protein
MERAARVELAHPTWKDGALPLSYARTLVVTPGGDTVELDDIELLVAP